MEFQTNASLAGIQAEKLAAANLRQFRLALPDLTLGSDPSTPAVERN
jgi:hypothetical protein